MITSPLPAVDTPSLDLIAPAPSPIIRLERVSKRYTSGKLALDDVSLDVPQGDFVFLVGASGAGKSTLVRLLIREELATGGRIWVEGQELGRLKRRHLPHYRRRVGIVFQDFKLLPRMTAWENVAFALRVTGVAEPQIRPRVEEVLHTVGLADKAEAFPDQMSGGEQQRVAIARALVHAPGIVIADEPTGNLDPATSWEIVQLLLQINQDGCTIVMATHNRDIVDMLRRRVVAIDAGRVARDYVGGYHEDGR